jgi:hypothetical protein
VGGAILGGYWARQQREEAVRQAASRSLKQLGLTHEEARAWEVGQRQAAVAPVAGGLAVAALDPGED